MPSEPQAVCLITEHILSHNNFRLPVLTNQVWSGVLQKFTSALLSSPLYTTLVTTHIPQHFLNKQAIRKHSKFTTSIIYK